VSIAALATGSRVMSPRTRRPELPPSGGSMMSTEITAAPGSRPASQAPPEPTSFSTAPTETGQKRSATVTSIVGW